MGAQKRERFRKLPVCWKCNQVGHIQCFCPNERNLKSDHRAKTAEEVHSDSDGDNGIFTAGGNLP